MYVLKIRHMEIAKLNLDVPRCEKCNYASIYTRIDGSIVCRRCGHIKRNKGDLKNEF